MFNKKIESLVISEAKTKNGKKVLVGQKEDGTQIILDAFSSAGQFAVFFDNKMIVTVCRDTFSEEGVEDSLNEQLSLKFVSVKSGISFFLRSGNGQWGGADVFPGLLSSLNDLERAFNYVIFIFTDCENKAVKGTKVLKLNERFADFLRTSALRSYVFFDKSPLKKSTYKTLDDLKKDWKEVLEKNKTSFLVELGPYASNGTHEIIINEEGYATYF